MKFVNNFSTIAKPLTQLTENGREFIWTKECQSSFDELKLILSSPPILAFPSDDPFILDRDASREGIGAVLSQVQNGREVVIEYYSSTFS